jgi:hypothetical protein
MPTVSVTVRGGSGRQGYLGLGRIRRKYEFDWGLCGGLG